MSHDRPGVADRAVTRFQEALGSDGLITSAPELDEFADPFGFRGGDRRRPSVVLQPASVEEVQAVLRIATEEGVPVWTSSQGRNYGYGGPAAPEGGGALLNLRRMNRVLEIDEDLAYAVVEPGVRFFDLFDALAERGHPLWPSIPDLGWGSVIGNTLEHGVGFTPLGDHPSRTSGLEVVLADGTLLRTGTGGMSGNRATWAAKRGFGPSLDGLFMQSNFGVVTKMGVWLTPRPETYMSCDVRIESDSSLKELIDRTRDLLLDGTIQNSPIVYNSLRIARAFGGVTRDYWFDGEGSIPPQVLDRMAEEMDCGRWFMRFALYGRTEQVDASFVACQRVLGAIPGARVEGTAWAGADVPSAVGGEAPPTNHPSEALAALRRQCAAVQAGVPSLTLLSNVRWEDPSVAGHLDYSPIAPLSGREANRLMTFLNEEYRAAGLDLSASLMLFPRSFITIAMMWYDTRDVTTIDRSHALLSHLIRSGADHGWSPYRAHVAVMDEVAALYDAGDHAQARVTGLIKAALDPAHVLSPGKQGIR